MIAGRLGLSMLAMQMAIGAINDRVDWPRDAAEKPGKPIPSGLATPGLALGWGTVLAAAGLALSAPSGPGTLAVAVLILAIGFIYDLRLSRTRWSWIPLALALPVLPVHAWLGSTGTIPSGLLTLGPAAFAAGGALALANGIVDLERDARTGRQAAAVALGPGRAWAIHAALLAVVAAVALLLAPTVPALDGSGAEAAGSPVPLEVLRGLRTWGVILGLMALALGATALRAMRPAIRERGWELEAVGVASVGLGWLAGTAASGGAV